MEKQPSSETVPAQHNRDAIIYLRHPFLPLVLALWRGGVERTLRKYGYIEITKAEYEGTT